MDDDVMRKVRRRQRAIGAVTVLEVGGFVYNLVAGVWPGAILTGTAAGIFLAVWGWSRREVARLRRMSREVGALRRS